MFPATFYYMYATGVCEVCRQLRSADEPVVPTGADRAVQDLPQHVLLVAVAPRWLDQRQLGPPSPAV